MHDPVVWPGELHALNPQELPAYINAHVAWVMPNYIWDYMNESENGQSFMASNYYQRNASGRGNNYELWARYSNNNAVEITRGILDDRHHLDSALAVLDIDEFVGGVKDSHIIFDYKPMVAAYWSEDPAIRFFYDDVANLENETRINPNIVTRFIKGTTGDKTLIIGGLNTPATSIEIVAEGSDGGPLTISDIGVHATAMTVINATLIQSDLIDVLFSREPNEASCENINNWTITDGIDTWEPLIAERRQYIDGSYRVVRLTLPNLPVGNYDAVAGSGIVDAIGSPVDSIENVVNFDVYHVLNSFSADTIITQRVAESLEVNGIVKEVKETSTAVDGIIAIVNTMDIDADGVIKVPQIMVISIDGIIRVSQTSNIPVDGIIKAPQTSNVSIDGIVITDGTKTIGVDGIVRTAKNITLPVGAIVKEPATTSISANAIIKGAQAKTLTVDGIIDNSSSPITPDDIEFVLRLEIASKTLVGGEVAFETLVGGEIASKTSARGEI
jgi:hypothetical protein